MLRRRELLDILRVGAELAVPDLRVRRLGREDVSASASTTQPKIWAFLNFEAPDERTEELATALPWRSYRMTAGMPTSRSAAGTGRHA